MMKKNKLVTKPREAGILVLFHVAALTFLLIICFSVVAHDAPFEVAAMSRTVEQDQTTEAPSGLLAQAHISGKAGPHISGAPGPEEQHISGVPGAAPLSRKKQKRGEKHGKRSELTVTFVQYLEFGEMTGDASHGGRAVIDPQSGVMETSGMTGLSGFHSRGELIIRGEPNQKFYVTLPKRVQLRNSNGVTSRLTNFKVYPSRTGVIGPDGFAAIYVGATLRLGVRRDGHIFGKSVGEVFIFVDYLED